MFLNFATVLAALGTGAAFKIANGARASGQLLFASILPEQQRYDYSVQAGTMTVRSTMAGLVGMDSPYPPGGMVEASTFLEKTAKIANEVRLNEATIRQMQDMMMRLQLSGQPTNDVVQREVLNFMSKVVVQPHLDTFEWLRSQALFTGAIDWTFGKVKLAVSYGVPTANFLVQRSGNDHYGGSASKFWVDIAAMRKLLRHNVRAFILNSNTLDVIRYNTANGMVPIAEGALGTIRTITFRRFARDASGAFDPRQFSNDSSDSVTFIVYDGESEVLNPADPTSTVIVQYVPDGKILAIGNNSATGYVVGQGTTPDPNDANVLGYTHIAPTVEGGGRPGRWGDMFTPEAQPFNLVGRAVTNGLPVIEAPEKIAVAWTDLS